MHLSVRSHLTTCGVFASAGILAVSLVAAPPDFNGARSEVREVQLAALALPSAAHLGALEEFISYQAQTVVPITKVIVGGTADLPGAGVNTPTAGVTTVLTFDSAIDRPTNTQKVEAATLEVTTAFPTLDPILGIVSPILALLTNPGALLLFGPLIVLVVLACPPCALINFVTGVIQSFLIGLTPLSAVALASTATVEAIATTDPSMTSELLLSDSIPATAKTAASADVAPASETRRSDVSPPSTSTDIVASTSDMTKTVEVEQESTKLTTEDEQVSTDTETSTRDMTEVADADEASTERTAASDPEPSAGASPSESAEATLRPATPRPVVRSSLGVAELLRDQTAVHTAGAGDGAATAESSSAPTSGTASSSTGSSSSSGGSSDGEADGS
jgi:hypothetical protein